MISGTVYGVVLNDSDERGRLSDAFGRAPYAAPPVAPVVYVKPRGTISRLGAAVPVPAEAEVRIAATVALLFERDASGVNGDNALGYVGAAALAGDVTLIQKDYYRPAIAQLGRDGFLPLGEFAGMPQRFGDIVTLIDGVERHRWSLDRLHRPLGELIAALSDFMTLRAGDVLLAGLPGDAPVCRIGDRLQIVSDGLPTLRTSLAEEMA